MSMLVRHQKHYQCSLLLTVLMRAATCPRFCRYDVTKKHPQGKILGAALSQVFDPELTNWFLAELAENRDRHVGPKKVSLCCSCKSVLGCIKFGTLHLYLIQLQTIQRPSRDKAIAVNIASCSRLQSPTFKQS